jgi:hypothetical protein
MNKFGCKVPQLAETETYVAEGHRRQLPPSAATGSRQLKWPPHTHCRPKAEWRFRDAKLRLFKCLHRDQGSSTVVEVGEC